MKGRRFGSFGRLVEEQIDVNILNTSTSDAAQRTLHKTCCAGWFADRSLSYLFIGAWAICSMACAPRRNSFEVDSPQRMKLRLEQAVPRGMLLADAHEIMRRQGFSCEQVKAGVWRQRRRLDYLRCVRDDGQMIKRRWDVAILHHETRVTAIDLRSALVYP